MAVSELPSSGREGRENFRAPIRFFDPPHPKKLIEERIQSGTIEADLGEPVDLAMRTEGLTAWYNNDPAHPAIRNISLRIAKNRITALIGPSGCGKSTLLWNLDRMHETRRGAGASGKVFLGNTNLFDPNIDPVTVRRVVGINFQKPTPFPGKNIIDNVLFGRRINKIGEKGENELEIVEHYLKQVALWNEVKDKLKGPGGALSGGQQQRLCIARTLAVKPEVILMDEPCASLDPPNTYKIEGLITTLKDDYSIVVVTHNMHQAARVSDYTAMMVAPESQPGEILEFGPTAQMFVNPQQKMTEDYISGHFG